jgi:hypothetical protein
LYEAEEVAAALAWCVVKGRVTEAAFWCQELLESGASGAVGRVLLKTWFWHFGVTALGIGRALASGTEKLLEITVTLARCAGAGSRDASVFQLLAGGAAVTKEFDRISEWEYDPLGTTPARQRAFRQALKQRKTLLAWCYARSAGDAVWSWMEPSWIQRGGLEGQGRWATRALAVAAAALTKKELANSEATTWKLLPTDLEATLAEWHELEGRARRVYSIPVDCLYWITERGCSAAGTADTLMSGLEAALRVSAYWQKELPRDFSKKEEAYDEFYMRAFPTDIPDEWSRADREKSHGRSVIGATETPRYEKYARRWFHAHGSRVHWADTVPKVESDDWDALYDAKQAEWIVSDAAWKLIPVKKVVVIRKNDQGAGGE